MTSDGNDLRRERDALRAEVDVLRDALARVERERDDLAAREDLFRGFAEQTGDVLWIADSGGRRLEYLSPAFDLMFGAPRDAILADIRNWAGLIHPADREAALAFMPRALAGEGGIADYRIIRPSDGRTIHLRDTGFPIRDASGAIVRVAGIVQDLSDMHAAKDALEAEKDRFRLLAEGIPQLIWRVAPGGHCTWVSPQWSAYTGLSGEESLGLGWLDALHPDDRGRELAAWHDAGDSFGTEVRLRQGRAGPYRWFQARAVPVRDEAGAITEWLGTSTDVDDLRRLEENARLLLAELQHRVRNSLGVIRSIARRTAANSAGVEDYAMHLDGRIGAFARVQAAVTRDPAAGLDLAQLVADELLAHSAREDDGLLIEGPAIRLRAKPAETLALAVHELATNAVKYGALAVPAGRIAVTWREEDRDDAPWLVFDWSEGGVPHPASSRRGFGTDLLERTLPYELKAEVALTFGADGIRTVIALPLTGRTLPIPTALGAGPN